MNENDKPLTSGDRLDILVAIAVVYIIGGVVTMLLGLGLNALGFAVLPKVPTLGQGLSLYLFWPVFLIKFVAFYVYWLFSNLISLLTF